MLHGSVQNSTTSGLEYYIKVEVVSNTTIAKDYIYMLLPPVLGASNNGHAKAVQKEGFAGIIVLFAWLISHD